MWRTTFPLFTLQILSTLRLVEHDFKLENMENFTQNNFGLPIQNDQERFSSSIDFYSTSTPQKVKVLMETELDHQELQLLKNSTSYTSSFVDNFFANLKILNETFVSNSELPDVNQFQTNSDSLNHICGVLGGCIVVSFVGYYGMFTLVLN